MQQPGLGQELIVFLIAVSAWLVPMIIAITFHEASHGLVAWMLGDDTAHRLGRVTFNPFAHIDAFGTVILPLILVISHAPVFGYAKPVPVDFRRLHRPRRDMVWVALAGPGANLILAFAAAFGLAQMGELHSGFAAWVAQNLDNLVALNLILAVFNMIPLPPLDGGRVAVGLLPDVLALPLARLERWGMLILFGLLIIAPLIGRQFDENFSLLAWVVGPPVDFLTRFIAHAAGLRVVP